MADQTLGDDEAEAGHAEALTLNQLLPDRLVAVAAVASRGLARIYARYELGVAEWRVLAALGQFGELTSKAAGVHTDMHKTKVSRAVAVLMKRQLIEQRRNYKDLRESLLTLTSAGQEIFQESAPLTDEFARRLEDVIPPAEREVFHRCLVALHRHARQLAGPGSDDPKD